MESYSFSIICFFHLAVYHDLCKLVYIHLNISFYLVYLCTYSLYIKEIFLKYRVFFPLFCLLLCSLFKKLVLACSMPHKNVYTHMWGLMGSLLTKIGLYYIHFSAFYFFYSTIFCKFLSFDTALILF